MKQVCHLLFSLLIKGFYLSPKPYPLNPSRGSITAPMLIISTSFILVIYALVFLLSNQFDLMQRQTAYDQALYVAEAGIQYYRWHLAHAPTNFSDTPDAGCLGPQNQPCHIYKDPQGKVIGAYALDITPPVNGSTTVTIRSTGWMTDYPAAKRTVRVQYGIPSLTKYSNLSNAVAWYGAGLTVHGLIHSNTGIRMDGINTSLVTNAQADYMCNHETGCSPSETKPGVWGAGPNSNLWSYPAPPVDFDAIFFDLAEMKQSAVTNGEHFGPSGSRGYHIVFQNNGTANVYRVTQTNSFHGYTSHEGCRLLNQNIQTQNLIGTFPVDSNPIFFFEDHTWVDGVVRGRVSVAAATFPLQASDTNIYINNNLSYVAKDGTNALGLIAHNDIIFGRDIPTNFEINGALMAQNGKIVRHGYLPTCGDHANAVRNSLTIYGSLLSNQKSYWNYGSGPTSGFITRTITYDASLLYGPPPYFPSDGEYEFISWQEE